MTILKNFEDWPDVPAYAPSMAEWKYNLARVITGQSTIQTALVPVNAAIAAETQARQAADVAQQAAIDAEIAARTAAEATEAAARVAGDASEASSRNMAVAAEAAARATVEAALQAEVVALQATDAAEATIRATAITNEATARAGADGVLQSQIVALGVNIKSFGAVGDGIADDTAHMQAAINSIPAGGIVFLPPGIYNFTTLIVPQGVVIQGGNNFCSVLRCTQASVDAVTLGVSSGIRRVKFVHSMVRFGAATVKITGNAGFVEDFQMSGYFVGVLISGTLSSLVVHARVVNGNMNAPALGAGSGGVVAENYADLLVADTLMAGAAAGTQADFGIKLMNGDAALISRNNITLHGRALYIVPGAGENTFATIISDSYFDSSNSGNSAEINPLSGGFVHEVKISNCWLGLSSAGAGCLVSGAAGTVDGIDFTGCQFPSNAANGLRLSSVQNVAVTGGHAEGNTGDGVYITNCTNVCVTGFRSGSVTGRGPNTQYGLGIDGTSDYVVVTGGNYRSNTVGTINNSASGTHIVLSNPF